MKTLLHICCAPCANQCIDSLRSEGIDLTGLWYNPNIHPFTEYRARRNCLREYAGTIDLPLIERDDYGLRPFVREVAEDIPGRCVKCYEMRFFEAARQAKEGGFDSFTSSLQKNTGWNFSTGTSVPCSGRARSGPRNWAFICRNIAAVFFPSRNGT